jgi:dTDP-glucose 4,6-dehydratase
LISIRDLVERICSRLGADFHEVVEIVGERRGKDSAYVLDSSKAHQKLGWSPSVDLDSGLDETIAWVRSNFEELKVQPLAYVHRK